MWIIINNDEHKERVDFSLQMVGKWVTNKTNWNSCWQEKCYVNGASEISWGGSFSC